MALSFPGAVGARVVINEIFYHAPDEIGDDLEYIELHNTDEEEEADIGGWAFTKGIQFKFPPNTVIATKGFVVLCRNRERFKEFYDTPVIGTFDSKLSNHGERIELSDARGRLVDRVKYEDAAPWPLGADGLSGSLERISPEAGGDNPANWASSPLSDDRLKPGGTPGKVNANFSAKLPPVVASVKLSPEQPAPSQAMAVEVTVREPGAMAGVTLFYRVAGPGFEKPEATIAMKKADGGKFRAEIPGQAANQLIRYRVQVTGVNGAKRFHPSAGEPRPALSTYVHDAPAPAKIPFGWILHTTEVELNAARQRLAARGRGFGMPELRGSGGGQPGMPVESKKGRLKSRSAFVHFDPATAKTEVFDFVEVEPRKGGCEIHLAKGQLLQEMSAINLIFEQDEKFMLAEPLAYEVYRRAGLAAEQSFHMRLWLDGQPLGYHLLVEQPNRGFLRRNKIDDGGNLYKVQWNERGVVGQHEKKTNTGEGHDDLAALLHALEGAQGEEAWELIRKQFDVPQVATYFAVNTVLSHWDGFFNNYLAYHDVHNTGRWMMFPWDQDQTWGIAGAAGAGGVFYQMPVSFGSEGGTRPGGYFSKPLLANAQFRKIYLARTRDLLGKVYTEQNFAARIDALGAQLRPEVRLRAELLQQDPDRAERNLQRNLQMLRDHLKKRRDFLIAQEEIKTAGPYSTVGLEAPVKEKKKKNDEPKPDSKKKTR